MPKIFRIPERETAAKPVIHKIPNLGKILIVERPLQIRTEEGFKKPVEIMGRVTQEGRNPGDYHEYEPLPPEDVGQIISHLTENKVYHPNQFVGIKRIAPKIETPIETKNAPPVETKKPDRPYAVAKKKESVANVLTSLEQAKKRTTFLDRFRNFFGFK